MAPLIQSQTCLIYYNFFTIKIKSHFKAFIMKQHYGKCLFSTFCDRKQHSCLTVNYPQRISNLHTQNLICHIYPWSCICLSCNHLSDWHLRNDNLSYNQDNFKSPVMQFYNVYYSSEFLSVKKWPQCYSKNITLIVCCFKPLADVFCCVFCFAF